MGVVASKMLDLFTNFCDIHELAWKFPTRNGNFRWTILCVWGNRPLCPPIVTPLSMNIKAQQKTRRRGVIRKNVYWDLTFRCISHNATKRYIPLLFRQWYTDGLGMIIARRAWPPTPPSSTGYATGLVGGGLLLYYGCLMNIMLGIDIPFTLTYNLVNERFITWRSPWISSSHWVSIREISWTENNWCNKIQKILFKIGSLELGKSRGNDNWKLWNFKWLHEYEPCSVQVEEGSRSLLFLWEISWLPN